MDCVFYACRICLRTSNKYNSIFSNVSSTESLQYSDLVSLISPSTFIEVGDKLPDNLCGNCKTKFDEVYELRLLCVNSDKTLRNCVESIETETEEPEEVEVDVVSEKPEEAEEESSKEVVSDNVKIEYEEIQLNEEELIEEMEVDDTTSFKIEYIGFDVGPYVAETVDKFVLTKVERMIHVETRDDNESKSVTEPIGSPDGRDGEDLIQDECPVCSKIFKERKAFRNHLRVHKQFPCKSCRKSFPTIGFLNKHIKDEHNDLWCPPRRKENDVVITSQECIICSRMFLNPKTFKNHMKKHEQGAHLCSTCSWPFDNEEQLTRHMYLHSDMITPIRLDISKKLCCQICQQNCLKKSSLIAHIRKQHENLDEPLCCEICGDYFANGNKFATHLNHHFDVKKKCNVCDKVYVSNNDIIDHIIRDHEQYGNYECEVCKLIFPCEYKMKIHYENTHTEKKWLCKLCGKQFCRSKLLANHMITHRKEEEKEFACGYCPKKFHFKAKLKIHERIHTGDRPFVCNSCDARFAHVTALRKHKLTIHSDERNFACKVCPKKFKTKHLLARHNLTHTGERPYSCKYCDRTFSQTNEMYKHLRVHLGENIFKCDECDKEFRLQGELRKHKELHFVKSKTEDVVCESIVDTLEEF